jgi:lantibiotic biosynthesis protein
VIASVPERAGAILAPDVRRRARATALEMGDRLYEIANRADNVSDEWLPSRSFAGTAGYALAFMALARATGESRYEAAMHDFLRRAARAKERPEISLYGGMSGLRAVAALAVSIEPRYAQLVAQCDAFIDASLPNRGVQPESFGDYDLIAGWAGIRLARCVDGPRERDAWADAMAWLLRDESRWRCVHPVRGGEPVNDLGLAHGMPGMLASLALTLDDADDLSDVLAANAAYLVAQSFERDGVVWWPYITGGTEPPRSAWCYGTPGVAASLFATAKLLGDENLARFSVRALESLAGASDAACIIDEANICHGRIGDALCVASVAASSESTVLDAVVERYVVAALDEIAENAGRCMSREDDGVKYDTFNEITGSAGVILGLLTLAGEFKGTWMRLHALTAIP